MTAARPCPFTARARAGDVVLAESGGAVVVEEPGAPPTLYFPVADLRPAALDAAGDGALRRVGPVPPALSSLGAFSAFDPAEVTVELLDPSPDGDPRGDTTKRFPVWGDARDLFDILDVRAEGSGRYRGVTRADRRRSVVEGSQMLGQAVVAAGRQSPGRRCVSAHMAFLRAADPAEGLVFDLEELSAGRSFVALACRVGQGAARCAAGQLLLDAGAPDVLRHEVEAPAVPGPYECPPYDMSVTGRDIRVVGGAYTDAADAPVGPPELDAWVRFREVPDDRCLHAGLLAQFTGHMAIAAALRPHAGLGQDQAHRTLSTAINAITIAFHREVRADRWLLYHHVSTFAGDGMTHAECRVHDEDGALVASFGVDAMVRAFPSGTPAMDERSTL
ncbi:MAG TPA: acyl-CoA thioesterase domain-containing protein [Acidimicrobiales bacterium]|nr:acyl-CoA thioesterase domain-containing protein [Acidimicrobiales bacterium]